MLNNIFYVFSTLLVISSIMVTLSKHPVFSLLFLVLSFIFASFLLIMLECEFLAIVFILIYVGAIGVLFLFAIMTLESKLIDLSRNVVKYISISVFFAVVLVLLFINEIRKRVFYDTFNFSYLNNYQNWYDLTDAVTDIEVYGQVLYSYFVLQFLIAGLILLVVLVGVVYLTNIYLVDDKTLEQSSFRQLARESKFFKKN